MPTKTAMILTRLDPIVKKETERIFKELGLSTSDAINLFLNQVRLHKRIPFEVTIPEVKEGRHKTKVSR